MRQFSSLTIHGLFGDRTIHLKMSGPVLVIVGHNGTGKSTAISILFFCLTLQWSRLATFRFEQIDIKFEDYAFSLSAVMIWMRRGPEPANFRRLMLVQFGKVNDDGKFEPIADPIKELLDRVKYAGPPPTQEEIDSVVNETLGHDPKLWIRGKFVAEFVASYFRRRILKLKAMKIKRTDGRHVRLHPAIATSDVSLCGEVGGTAIMPESLRNFLSQY